ncbi:MAG: zinc ribbon domain-containing protein [Xanthomonadales bacterium]|jgi:putative FmdB family regulatory protein|nr:zinc ribbon domain-containing protein [Gammaproteobacteria bacterium]NNJ66026.1 zinc ribbon domain-containing protein [Xanthomonadales bacterium]NNK33288.1 zinc ribbon domain-containing protein [Xanthomonadales bacterium]
MPIYEYQCNACGHELEKLQRMSDAPLTDCPDCGEAELRRLVSAAGFRLKGGGWYETDFKKDGKRNLHGADTVDKPAKPKPKKDAAKPSEVKKTVAKASASSGSAA